MTEMTAAAADTDQPTDQEPPAEVTAGIDRLMGHFTGYFAISLLGLGHRSGLLAALLEGGGTAAQIAARAGAHERSAQEWLAALTAAGYTRHDDGVFTTVDGQDAVFRPGLLPFDVTVFLEFQEKFGSLVGQVAAAMRDGKGVPYSAYQPEFGVLQDRLNGPLYEQVLVSDFVASAEGLTRRLQEGVDVADVGCGGGQALCLLAAAFPASRFVGYDIDDSALEIARTRAAERGLDNVAWNTAMRRVWSSKPRWTSPSRWMRSMTRERLTPPWRASREHCGRGESSSWSSRSRPVMWTSTPLVRWRR